MINMSGDKVSLQVSNLKNITGAMMFRTPVLIKNITDDNITCEIMISDEWIETVMYPGWNSELIKGIRGVTANQLQYGF